MNSSFLFIAYVPHMRTLRNNIGTMKIVYFEFAYKNEEIPIKKQF